MANAGTKSQGGLAFAKPAQHAFHEEAIETFDSVAPNTESEVANLRFNAKGFASCPKSTSLFEPQVGGDETFPLLATSLEAISKRRERLVQNAWQQKSLEVLADTPVSSADYARKTD